MNRFKKWLVVAMALSLLMVALSGFESGTWQNMVVEKEECAEMYCVDSLIEERTPSCRRVFETTPTHHRWHCGVHPPGTWYHLITGCSVGGPGRWSPWTLHAWDNQPRPRCQTCGIVSGLR